MAQKPIPIVFLWHMHQPIYLDPKHDEPILPWVRLHCAKDYLDMVQVVEDVPGTRVVINAVPCLLQQLEDQRKDAFYHLSAKDAASLTDDERQVVVRQFFSANRETMIRQLPRYDQLYGSYHGADASTIRNMPVGDLRDLQLLFNLAWCGETLRRDPDVRALVDKQKHFEEADKLMLLEKQRQLMGKVVPRYRDLVQRGIIEVSTTPFYHPILPLLFDIETAQASRPTAELPDERFAYPDDALRQVAQSVQYYTELFGSPPQGMWPAEGAVSERALELLDACHLRWAATDEGILANSLGDAFNAQSVYQAYQWQGLTMFFRDRVLSDRLGFVYSKWRSEHAVADVIAYLEGKLGLLSGLPNPVIPVILDGENAWEYYPEGGMPFLRKLYEAIAEHPRFTTTTFRAFLDHPSPRTPLHRVHPGSWINSDFSTWIGDPVKNTAWSLLAKARKAVEEHSPATANVDGVLEALSIAEGSDWFWWFGEGHACDHEREFDQLFRAWVGEVYRRLGVAEPPDLQVPLCASGETPRYTQPLFPMTPPITGNVESYYKWVSAGVCKHQSGAIHQTDPIIKTVYFGVDLDNLYLRIDLFECPAGTTIETHHYRFAVISSSPLSAEYPLRLGDSCAAGDVIECRIPFQQLGGPSERPLAFSVVVTQNEREMQRFPRYEPIQVSFPGPEFGLDNWIV